MPCPQALVVIDTCRAAVCPGEVLVASGSSSERKVVTGLRESLKAISHTSSVFLGTLGLDLPTLWAG